MWNKIISIIGIVNVSKWCRTGCIWFKFWIGKFFGSPWEIIYFNNLTTTITVCNLNKSMVVLDNRLIFFFHVQIIVVNIILLFFSDKYASLFSFLCLHLIKHFTYSPSFLSPPSLYASTISYASSSSRVDGSNFDLEVVNIETEPPDDGFNSFPINVDDIEVDTLLIVLISLFGVVSLELVG